MTKNIDYTTIVRTATTIEGRWRYPLTDAHLQAVVRITGQLIKMADGDRTRVRKAIKRTWSKKLLSDKLAVLRPFHFGCLKGRFFVLG